MSRRMIRLGAIVAFFATLMVAVFLLLESGRAAPPPRAWTPLEAAFFGLAVSDCDKNHRPTPTRIAYMAQWFELGRMHGLPPGLELAAICGEAAYNPWVGCGDRGKSCSPIQFREWARGGMRRWQRRLGSRYPDALRDPLASVAFWGEHHRRQLRWVRGQGYRFHNRGCKFKRADWDNPTFGSLEVLEWAVANATAVRPLRYERGKRPRCNQVKRGDYTHHYGRWARWRDQLAEPYRSEVLRLLARR